MNADHQKLLQQLLHDYSGQEEKETDETTGLTRHFIKHCGTFPLMCGVFLAEQA